MDFLCYLHDAWKPLIRPAEPTRAWMDVTPDAFAYRCLPLNIANAHGWEILTPAGFSAYWRGGARPEDVVVRPDADMGEIARPVPLFGQGTFTIHIQGLFRTPPGWNLMVGGSPNSAKDGIAPLSGVIETDWSPYTFTMNWRLTRRNHWVRFEKNEPICFIMPVQRDALERMEPKLAPLSANPDLERQFNAWSASRNAFQAEVAERPPTTSAEQWQKRYYRGLDMNDRQAVADHRAKLRLKPFVPGVPNGESADMITLRADRLEAAITVLVAEGRDGKRPDPAVLEKAGVPRPVAARIVRALRTA